ncbi:Succinate--CoA ligase [ADP-forming] subunit beta, mitochondrial-like protein [Drosera capensis]
MVRGPLNKLLAQSLSVAGKWQHQHQQLRRLNIHEYQGAELMSKYGINVPNGVAVSSLDEVKNAVKNVFPNQSEIVVKSQVLAGGRGLGTFKNGFQGGVHIVKADQVEEIAGKMLGQILVTKQTGPQGKIVNKVYLCEKLSLVNEMYFAITLDRKTAGPIIIACSKGGTSIEDLAEKYPDMIIKVPIDVFKGITDEDATKVVDGLAPKVADKASAIEQVKKLYSLFRERDCTLLEINPIAETSDKQLVAADAKLNFDDNAAFRHKDIFELRDTSQEDPREIIIACSKGGTSIEDLAEQYPDMIIKVPIDVFKGITDEDAAKVVDGLAPKVADKASAIEQVKKLYSLFCERDCTLLEINPIAETSDKQLVAADAKLNFDDNAAFRQKDIFQLRDTSQEDPREVAAAKADLNYIGLDGEIGCMVNGAGLAMATMDIIKLHGGTPANFLDVGGSASEHQVVEAFKILTADERVKAILVNIFGGIMKCDIIASGIVNAAKEVALKVPVVVRLEGTNVDQGKRILKESGMALITAEDLDDAAEKAVKATSK